MCVCVCVCVCVGVCMCSSTHDETSLQQSSNGADFGQHIDGHTRLVPADS